MLKLPESTRALIREAKELFPEEGVGFNWDTWNSIEEYEVWLREKIADRKASANKKQ